MSHDMSTSTNHAPQKQNSVSRYFASEGKIAIADILPQNIQECQLSSGPWTGQFEKEEMLSVHGRLLGWMLRTKVVQA